jgi:chemotaxis protein CheZ
MDNTNDSAELEALFDTISAQENLPAPAPAAVKPPPEPSPVAPPASNSTGDNDDLQDLFDSIACTAAPKVAANSVAISDQSSATGDDNEAWNGQEGVYKRIGKMARELHDALHELGYDKLLENAVTAVPDARDRLAYIANITEQAACRVLNATDVAQPLVEKIQADSNTLANRWDAAFNNQLDVNAFRVLAEDSRAYFKTGLPHLAGETNTQLLEIMMAQDFQDLTGQVIKKIVGLAESLENGLMKVLVEIMPEHCKKSEEVSSLLNGPVVTTEGRTDVVVSQQQVDDLLDTLGF